MAEWVGGLLAMLIWAAYPASMYAWFQVWKRRSRSGAVSEPLLPVAARSVPFWTLADAVVLVGLFLVIGGLLSGIAQWQGWIEPLGSDGGGLSLPEILLQSLTTLLASVVMVALLSWRSAEAWSKLGLVPQWEDVRLGALAALLILPPVTLIMRVATLLVDYEHPVLAQLESAPSWPIVLALFASSVLVAPLCEEFAFRVMLQGSLQRFADWPTEDQVVWVPRSDWPVIVSSALFALMHAGQGPAPIPLFFLALGLGYLYRQTGSLIPPLVVHLILNGVTMVATVLQLLS